MSYAKGRSTLRSEATAEDGRLEYRTIRYLERQGFRCIRSAGSPGPADVVAVNESGGLFVQVKANRRPSRAEIALLAVFPCPAGFKRIVHRWQDYGHEPEGFPVGETP
ncbi:MAG: hypothetical protein HYT87_19765 [Nitrospirae bacterium]|nr:hypothetical protein [Nitrospirota bacterium]